MSRIPSFTTLRAFEAVARLGNMTRAAEELSVTHSAISKQVQALEEEFGIQLLRRMPRAIPKARGWPPPWARPSA